MKVLVIHRYFWPQNYPYATMLKSIVESLVSAGHHVDVLTTSDSSDAESSSREQWASQFNVNINSIALGSEKQHGLLRKVLNAFYFGTWILFRLLFWKQQVVLVATTPPVIIATLVRWASKIRGFNYVYHCQDIHPEAMSMTGTIRNRWLYLLLMKMDVQNINQAWKVITLSEDMRQTIKKRGCRIDHIELINNFIFEKLGVESTDSEQQNKIRFLFAGSLGRLQNLELMISSFEPFKYRDDVEFVIMGDGVLRRQLEHMKEDKKLANVHFCGQKPLNEALAAMRSSDVGLVSLSPGIIDVAYPSKCVMYFGNGLPVLAIIDEGSDLANLIAEEDIGLAVSPHSVSEISAVIAMMIDRCQTNPISHQHVQETAYRLFGKAVILEKFVSVFSK